ncbi:intracellular septation protein A [Williamsia sp. 1138]|uniref:inner membrane-spanning protein YciB n=1 Tax=Williamsia sp. 1138 TaxID=1903117 RepID=UPI000A11A982|nr:septation protein IspZ [Williamsia sp. 1138]OZG29750.1 intracellular septation protein A [Williamsia sp. 1138]
MFTSQVIVDRGGLQLILKLAYNVVLALAFLVSYRLGGIYVATSVLMAGVSLEVAYIFVSGRRPTKLEWVGLALVIALGAATLLLGDALFIEWRPTGFYWLCAIALAGTRLWMRKNPIAAVLNSHVPMASRAWEQVLWLWIAFLTLLGALNLVIAYNFSLDTWVNYRVFGAPGMIAIFALMMIVWRRDDIKRAWRTQRAATTLAQKDSSSADR